MTQTSGIRALLHRVYGYAFFDKLTFLAPVYAIYMQSHGVSDIQLSFLFILFSVGTIVCQPLVMTMTMRLGVRRTLMVGQLMKIFAFALWFWWPTWIGFMVGMFIWGMQSGFYGVTFEGMLYDEMAARRRQNMYTRVLGRRCSIETLATAVSAAGSLMMIWGYGWVTMVSIISVLASMGCLVGMRLRARPMRQKSARIQPIRLSRLLARGMGIAWQTPCVMMAMVTALMVLNFSYLEDYLGPIGLQIGLPVMYVGAIQFMVLGASMIGQTVANYFRRIRDGVLGLLIAMGGALFIGFGWLYSVPAMALLGMAYVIFKGANVLLYARFQMTMPARYRSLLLSLYTTLNHAIYIGVCLVVGWGGKMGSWRYSICVLGMMLMVLGVGYIMTPRRCGAKIPGAMGARRAV